MLAAFANKSYGVVFKIARTRCYGLQPGQARIQNILSWATFGTKTHNYSRIIMRLAMREPASLSFSLMEAHSSLATHSLQFAVAEYFHAHSLDRDHPLIILLLGVCHLHLACLKFGVNRNHFLITALGFITRYMSLRGVGQEGYYNMGRALHQVSMFSEAATYLYV